MIKILKPPVIFILFILLITAPALTTALSLSCWSEFDNAYDDRWKPGQQKILFNSLRDGNREIYVMNADGTDQTRLTFSNGIDRFPGWSPDRSRIVFTSNRDGNAEIYVMNFDGTRQTRLANNSADDQRPSWSPDGTRIVFASNRTGDPEIHIMNADGTGAPRNLTNYGGANDENPSWSPF